MNLCLTQTNFRTLSAYACIHFGFLFFIITVNRPYYGKVNVRSSCARAKYIQHNKKKVLATLLTLRDVMCIPGHYLCTVTCTV